MTRSPSPHLVLALGLCLLTPCLRGQTPPAPPTEAAPATRLEDLLPRIRARSRTLEAALEARLAQAAADRAAQEKALAEAREALRAEELRGQELEARFRALEEERLAQRAELEERGADLTALGDSFRGLAEELRGDLDGSLVRAELPERSGELEALGAGSGVPRVEEIESLWFLLQQEMTRAARSRRFQAPVIGEDGLPVPSPVTRVGPFAAVSRGRFLEPLPGEASLRVQSPGAGVPLEELAQSYEKATSWAPFPLDPTRGRLLALLARRPDSRELLRQGGLVGGIILGLGALALLLTLERLLVLGWVGRKIRRQRATPATPREDNPLGRVLVVGTGEPRGTPEELERKLDAAVLAELPALTRGLRLLRLIATASPLLGLLGTVTGMILTFQQITLHGAGDPRILAGGISQALVTTALGLSVAIPVVFLHRLASSRAEALVQVLEEESAGILARSWEEPA